RIHGLADVLGTVERDDLDEHEIRVDVDDGTVGGEAVLHVRGSLSGFPVDRLGRAVSPLDGLVEYLVPAYPGGIGEYRPVPAGNDLAGRDLDVRLAVRGERARVPGNPVDQITTHRVTGGPNGPAGHISLSGGRGGTTITDAGVHRLHGHSLQSQFGTHDLLHHGDKSLTDLAARAPHGRAEFSCHDPQRDPRGRVVVESLGETDVLDADGVA